jgi:hypothetical protein
MKKAAMFGLDARIAVAIFGALSVISGAALYSAIQNAKITAAITEIKEIEKALEQYILDTGNDLTLENSAHYRMIDLIKKPANVSGWNGPYLNYDEISGSNLKIQSGSSLYNLGVFLRHGKEADWDPTNWELGCTSSTKPCAMWIEVEGIDINNPAIGLKMDEIFDNSDGYAKGSVRAKTGTSIMYKFKQPFKQP